MDTVAVNRVQLDVAQSKPWATLIGKVAKPHRQIQACSGVLVDADGRTVGAYNMETVLQLPGFAFVDDADLHVLTLDAWKRALAVGSFGEADCTPSDDAPLAWVRSSVDTRGVAPAALSDTGDSFTRALRYCAIACSRDESRPVFTGIRVEASLSGDSVNVSATDSYRLHVAENVGVGSCHEDLGVILPGYVAKLLKSKTSYVGHLSHDSHVAQLNVFDSKPSGQPYTLIMRTIQGTFPSWQQLKPSGFETMRTASGESLKTVADSLKRASKAVMKNMPVAFNPAEDTLQAVDGSWEMPFFPADESSDGFRVGISSQFGLDAVKGLSDYGCESVTLQAISPLRPMLFSGTPDTWALVMPVRLPE